MVMPQGFLKTIYHRLRKVVSYHAKDNPGIKIPNGVSSLAIQQKPFFQIENDALFAPFSVALDPVQQQRFDALADAPVMVSSKQNREPVPVAIHRAFLKALMPRLAAAGFEPDTSDGPACFLQGSATRYVAFDDKDYNDIDWAMKLRLKPLPPPATHRSRKSASNRQSGESADEVLVRRFYSHLTNPDREQWGELYKFLRARLEGLQEEINRVIHTVCGEKMPQVTHAVVLDMTDRVYGICLATEVGRYGETPHNYSFLIRFKPFPFPDLKIGFDPLASGKGTLYSTPVTFAAVHHKLLLFDKPHSVERCGAILLFRYAVLVSRGWTWPCDTVRQAVLTEFKADFFSAGPKQAGYYENKFQKFLTNIMTKHACHGETAVTNARKALILMALFKILRDTDILEEGHRKAFCEEIITSLHRVYPEQVFESKLADSQFAKLLSSFKPLSLQEKDKPFFPLESLPFGDYYAVIDGGLRLLAAIEEGRTDFVPLMEVWLRVFEKGKKADFLRFAMAETVQNGTLELGLLIPDSAIRTAAYGLASLLSYITRSLYETETNTGFSEPAVNRFYSFLLAAANRCDVRTPDMLSGTEKKPVLPRSVELIRSGRELYETVLHSLATASVSVIPVYADVLCQLLIKTGGFFGGIVLLAEVLPLYDAPEQRRCWQEGLNCFIRECGDRKQSPEAYQLTEKVLAGWIGGGIDTIALLRHFSAMLPFSQSLYLTETAIYPHPAKWHPETVVLLGNKLLHAEAEPEAFMKVARRLYDGGCWDVLTDIVISVKASYWSKMATHSLADVLFMLRAVTEMRKKAETGSQAELTKVLRFLVSELPLWRQTGRLNTEYSMAIFGALTLLAKSAELNGFFVSWFDTSLTFFKTRIQNGLKAIPNQLNRKESPETGGISYEEVLAFLQLVLSSSCISSSVLSAKWRQFLEDICKEGTGNALGNSSGRTTARKNTRQAKPLAAANPAVSVASSLFLAGQFYSLLRCADSAALSSKTDEKWADIRLKIMEKMALQGEDLPLKKLDAAILLLTANRLFDSCNEMLRIYQFFPKLLSGRADKLVMHYQQSFASLVTASDDEGVRVVLARVEEKLVALALLKRDWGKAFITGLTTHQHPFLHMSAITLVKAFIEKTDEILPADTVPAKLIQNFRGFYGWQSLKVLKRQDVEFSFIRMYELSELILTYPKRISGLTAEHSGCCIYKELIIPVNTWEGLMDGGDDETVRLVSCFVDRLTLKAAETDMLPKSDRKEVLRSCEIMLRAITRLIKDSDRKEAFEKGGLFLFYLSKVAEKNNIVLLKTSSDKWYTNQIIRVYERLAGLICDLLLCNDNTSSMSVFRTALMELAKKDTEPLFMVIDTLCKKRTPAAVQMALDLIRESMACAVCSGKDGSFWLSLALGAIGMIAQKDRTGLTDIAVKLIETMTQSQFSDFFFELNDFLLHKLALTGKTRIEIDSQAVLPLNDTGIVPLYSSDLPRPSLRKSVSELTIFLTEFLDQILTTRLKLAAKAMEADSETGVNAEDYEYWARLFIRHFASITIGTTYIAQMQTSDVKREKGMKIELRSPQSVWCMEKFVEVFPKTARTAFKAIAAEFLNSNWYQQTLELETSAQSPLVKGCEALSPVITLETTLDDNFSTILAQLSVRYLADILRTLHVVVSSEEERGDYIRRISAKAGQIVSWSARTTCYCFGTIYEFFIDQTPHLYDKLRDLQLFERPLLLTLVWYLKRAGAGKMPDQDILLLLTRAIQLETQQKEKCSIKLELSLLDPEPLILWATNREWKIQELMTLSTLIVRLTRLPETDPLLKLGMQLLVFLDRLMQIFEKDGQFLSEPDYLRIKRDIIGSTVQIKVFFESRTEDSIMKKAENMVTLSGMLNSLLFHCRFFKKHHSDQAPEVYLMALTAMKDSLYPGHWVELTTSWLRHPEYNVPKDSIEAALDRDCLGGDKEKEGIRRYLLLLLQLLAATTAQVSGFFTEPDPDVIGAAIKYSCSSPEELRPLWQAFLIFIEKKYPEVEYRQLRERFEKFFS